MVRDGKWDESQFAYVAALEAWLFTAARKLAVMVALSCAPLHEPPAKRCVARDTIRLDSLPDTLRVVRGCP